MKKKNVKKFKELKKDQKYILDLNRYPNIPFELLLSYSIYIIKYFFQTFIFFDVQRRVECKSFLLFLSTQVSKS